MNEKIQSLSSRPLLLPQPEGSKQLHGNANSTRWFRPSSSKVPY